MRRTSPAHLDVGRRFFQLLMSALMDDKASTGRLTAQTRDIVLLLRSVVELRFDLLAKILD
jgi:hypothetical protein